MIEGQTNLGFKLFAFLMRQSYNIVCTGSVRHTLLPNEPWGASGQSEELMTSVPRTRGRGLDSDEAVSFLASKRHPM